MTDRRSARAALGVAHVSRRGISPADRYVEGTWMRLARPLSDLCAAPDGARERQLLLGARFCVLVAQGGWAYGFDVTGYCGWVAEAALGPDAPVTHWVSAPATHLYPAPDLKRRETAWLSLGAALAVEGVDSGYARTPQGHVPLQHLSPLAMPAADPVAVARLFLGTPYLWGGNSRAGLDCSALVQAALRACGIDCPGDSDQQAAMPWAPVAAGDERPGDLVFWKGHVAMVCAKGEIIHANAHHMATAIEPLGPAIDRIAAKGDAVTARLRPSIPGRARTVTP